MVIVQKILTFSAFATDVKTVSWALTETVCITLWEWVYKEFLKSTKTYQITREIAICIYIYGVFHTNDNSTYAIY